MRSTTNVVVGLTILFVSKASAASLPVNATQDAAVAPICDSAVNRNQATWVAGDMGLWFKEMTIPYILTNWDYPNGGGPVTSIQDLMLQWANDGENPCGFLSTNCNPNPEYSQCEAYPEANFLWYATAAFSNYLGNMASAVLACDIVLTDFTGSMVQEFFTPPNKPTTLIEPISISAGIAAAISVFFPPAAIIAGMGAMANGMLTQAGLNTPNPLIQWTDVMAQLGSMTKETVEFIGTYWTMQLGSQPNISRQAYFQDPTALPAVLYPGGFAASTSENVATFPDGLYGALASAGINALWNSDKAFIVKMSDATLGKGAGQACAQYPGMTYCDNGEAYFFIRWVFHDSLEAGKEVSSVDTSNWQVWGAYPSAAGNPSGNSDQLSQYGLDLGVVALSSLRVQQAYGFWSNQTAQATIDSVQADITDLTLDRIISWNMLVCDLDEILNGQHFLPTGTWFEAIVCSCGNMKDVNGKAWPLPYPSTATISLAACSGQWTS